MNVITDEQIEVILNEQMNYLKSTYDEKQCLGLFTYGKVNYGFAEKLDDIKTVLCYIPSFEELCTTIYPLKIKYITDDKNRKIRICDIRLLYELAISQEDIIIEAIFSKYHIINNAPNGTNINNNCGSTHPEVLSSYVINNKLDIGIAYDGDADRVVFIDELGNIINGDYTLAIISNDLKNKNRLNKNTIVGTILSNLGLLEYCKNNDIEFITTNVGDKYVLEYLRDNNLSLGGEEAGHIILKEYCNTGDGPLTSLIMLSILASTNTTFSNLTNIMHKYPEVHINIKVNNKNDFATSNMIEDSIKEIKNNFNGNYRLVVRPSGTEPLVRIVLEGEELKVLEESSNKIKSIIKNLNMEVV